MGYKELLLLACLGLLGGLRLTSTTTTTTFVAAMSIANQDLERYFRSANVSQTLAGMHEDRIVMDVYNYAFLTYEYMDPQPKFVSFDEEKARYGEGKVFNVTGKLVHVTQENDLGNDTACAPNIRGTLGGDFPPLGVTWIALVRRGGCRFEDKVRHVHAKGAAGVIIYNDREVVSLEKMQIIGQERLITAVITYQDIGLEMAKVVDRGIDMTASILEGRRGQRPINSLNRTSVLFVSISFIVLMVISLVWLIFYYIQRFRYLQTKDQQSRHLCSVTKKAIMKIPTKTGKSSDEKDADSDCCAICIEAYKASDCIRVLPCKHEFHKTCIDPWLVEHRTCPMCKLDVLKFYGFVFLGSEESILEYEPDRPDRPPAAAATGALGGGAGGPRRTSGALADLIRSRDFVIDFPRIFVLDAGGAVGTRDSLLPTRPPERSQSSLALTPPRDWMTAVSNKLEEQQGLYRWRKQKEMEEHLLAVRSDSVKRRRSRSADGRFSQVFNGRREFSRTQVIQAAAVAGTVAAGAVATAVRNPRAPPAAAPRRNSDTLRAVGDAFFGSARAQQREESAGPGTSVAWRSTLHRASEIPLRELQTSAAEEAGQVVRRRESSPPTDVSITIQVNGEGIDLE